MALGVSTVLHSLVAHRQCPCISQRSLQPRYELRIRISKPARVLDEIRSNALASSERKPEESNENVDEDEAFSDEELFSDDELFEEEEEEEESEEDEAGHADVVTPESERARKIDEFCAIVRGREDMKVKATELISLHPFRLDKFQRLSIEAFLKGSSVVVSAPTSSGKTVIAEAAATMTLARRKKLYYTTPLKALSNQKFKEFRAIFGEGSVGLVTGDISFNRDAPIVIMTAEILRNRFYLSDDNLDDVEIVVLDEIHYISDPTRGTVWEEMVIYCPKAIQLICLSATIANPDELAGWIAKVHGPTELITSSKRPVPLTWYISRRSEMFPLLNEKGTGLNRKLQLRKMQLEEIRSSPRGRVTTLERRLPENQLQVLLRFQVPRIRDTLKQMIDRNMLPALWFILSRKGCDQAVQYLQDAKLLSEDEVKEVDEAIKRFRELYPEAIRESAVRPLYQGVAAHHAGCLPLWKGLIEELFQRGLVKVVFATETLAAGINMPARSTVLSSFVTKGPRKLSSNSILQMAGRAGRRGIDSRGYVVVAQTPFRGPEECFRLLRTGSDPLTSQFTASYGMVLNLLQDTTGKDSGVGLGRSLIEQSFGNYMGSEILLGAKRKLAELRTEIETLESGRSTDSVGKLYEDQVKEYHRLKEKVEMKERKERSLRFKVESLRTSVTQSQLKDIMREDLPYVSLVYVDSTTGKPRKLSALMVETSKPNPFSLALGKDKKTMGESSPEVPPYLALGFDRYWYRFPESLVRRVYRSDVGLDQLTGLKDLLADVQWELIGDEKVSRSKAPCSGFTLPALNKLTSESEVPEELEVAEKMLAEQQKSLLKWSNKLAGIDEREINELVVRLDELREEKIHRLKAKSERISNRIKQMQPSGWAEFLEVMEILKASGAVHPSSDELLPLGEIARALRGSNELWLAMALRDESLLSLRPSELAAVAASLVSESMNSKPEVDSIYQPSPFLMEWIGKMEVHRTSLAKLQEEHGVEFPCEMDPQYAGLVEAWASGVNWKELEIEYIMAEGDFARLLRRTIDLLSQIPHLPHLDQALSKTAKEAAKNMDRPPISEPVGG